jgi:GH24 family phage-related lysozyme (muramidase)
MAKPGDKDTTEKKPASVADAPDSVSDQQKDDASKKEKNEPKDVATETTQSQSLQILNTLVAKQQETTDGILALIEATEGNKDSKEDEKEEEKKKKSFFDGIKGMFKKMKEGTPDFFKGLSEMMKKYKKILIGLLGAGLIAFFGTMDMETFGKLWKSVKDTMVSAYKFLKPIVLEIAKWFEETAFPSTVDLLIKTWRSIEKLFTDLKDRFEGWTEEGWYGKMLMILGSLSNIGGFVIGMFNNLADWIANLCGYKGSITTDISKKFTDFGESLKKTFKEMLYAWMPKPMADAIIKKMKEWFGDDKSTPEDESLMGRLGGIIKGIVGALALSLLIPGGFGLLLSGITTVIGLLFSGIVAAIGSMGFLLNPYVLIGVAVAALAIWIGKLIYDNIDAIKGMWTKIMDTAKKWFKAGISGILGLFGIKTDDRTAEELKQDQIEQTKKDQAEAKKVREQGANLAIEKRDLVAIDAEMQEKENAMAAIGMKNDKASQLRYNELATSLSKLRAEKIKIMDEEEKAAKDEVKETKKITEKRAVLKKVTGVDLEQLKMDEGFSSKVYSEDFAGHGKEKRTIGYGFNMDRAGAQEALDAAGIKKSLADLKSGKVEITKEEASRLMRGEYAHFADAAKRFVNKGKKGTWSKLTLDRQKILTNMAYNMGEGKLNGFNDLRTALQEGNIEGAGAAMKDSDWFRGATGKRAGRLIARMTDNTTGTQLAAAQTAGGNLEQLARSNVIIAPSTVNQNNNSTPLHLAENTFKDDQVNFHST